jgi:hypothetical protein
MSLDLTSASHSQLPLCTAKCAPGQTSCCIGAGYRLSAIGYRLSAIGYRHQLDRTERSHASGSINR